jgi:RHS repeat-associated protein
VLGVYYAKARMYDAADKRWMAQDSIRGTVTWPLTLNRYVYVIDNPIRYIDPSGLWMSDVHYEKTMRWVNETLGDGKEAALIAEANNSVDGIFKETTPYLWFNKSATSWHFNTAEPLQNDSRLVLFCNQFNDAIGYCNFATALAEQSLLEFDSFTRATLAAEAKGYWEFGLQKLGQGLHSLQDYIAHGAWKPNHIIPSPHKAYLDKFGCVNEVYDSKHGKISYFDDPDYDLYIERRFVSYEYSGETLIYNENIFIAREGTLRIKETEQRTKGALKSFMIAVNYEYAKSLLNRLIMN